MPASDPEPIQLPRGRSVPESALQEQATTSGGPGGQHANRSATQVELRVQLHELPLTQEELQRVYERLGGRISAEGVLAVRVRDFRSQLRNRRAARERLQELIQEALEVEEPRRPTRVPRGVRRRWREAKEHQSKRKQARRWQPPGD